MAAARTSRWLNVRRIVACWGIGGLVEEAWARLRHRLSDPRGTMRYADFRTSDWDRRRGVRTEGNVWIEELNPDLPNRGHSEGYLPTDIWSFQEVIGILLGLGVRPPEFTMLDLGCGKGRVVLMGVEAGFREVIGVEFAPEIARQADENLRSYRGRRRGVASVHCGDAAAFPIPAGPLFIFLFNPFRGPVLEAVAENIRRSFAGDHRVIYVVYLYPKPDSPFRRGAPFVLVESGPFREIYRLVADSR